MNQDFVDLLRAFAEHDVEAIIVGAHALAAHGHIRATKDLDVWIRPSPENAAHAHRALKPSAHQCQSSRKPTYTHQEPSFRSASRPFGSTFNHIDGVDFEEAWKERIATTVGGVNVFVLSRAHLERQTVRFARNYAAIARTRRWIASRFTTAA